MCVDRTADPRLYPAPNLSRFASKRDQPISTRQRFPSLPTATRGSPRERNSTYVSRRVTSSVQPGPAHPHAANHRTFSATLTRLKHRLTRRKAARAGSLDYGRTRQESLGSFGASSAWSLISRRTEGKDIQSKRMSWMSWSSLRHWGTNKSSNDGSSDSSQARTESYVHVELPIPVKSAVTVPASAAPADTSILPRTATSTASRGNPYTSYGHRWLAGYPTGARRSPTSAFDVSPPPSVSDEQIWSLWRSWLREKRSKSRDAQ